MRQILILTLLLGAIVAVMLTGSALGSSARQATPLPDPRVRSIVATAEALDVPPDCVVALASPPATTAVPASTTATVTLFDMGYRPCALTIPADTPMTITLTNEGTAVGNLVIDHLGIRTALLAQGETGSVVIDAPPGIYPFYSEPPGQRDAGRAGILVVVGDDPSSNQAPFPATPQPVGPGATLAGPDPVECQVEPRSLEAVLALYLTPDVPSLDDATPVIAAQPVDLPSPLPGGPPADAETVAAVQSVWRESYACINAGDLPRLAALATDDAFRRQLAPTEIEQLAADLLTLDPLPAGERAFVPPLSDVRLLPDSRVGGLIDVGPAASPENAGNNYVIFVQEGDRWLIDEVVAQIG